MNVSAVNCDILLFTYACKEVLLIVNLKDFSHYKEIFFTKIECYVYFFNSFTGTDLHVGQTRLFLEKLHATTRGILKKKKEKKDIKIEWSTVC